MPTASATATIAVRTEVPAKSLGYTPPEAPAAAESRPATIGPSAQPTLPPTRTSPKALDRIPGGVTSATIALRDASNIDQPTKPWAAETARYPEKPPTSERGIPSTLWKWIELKGKYRPCPNRKASIAKSKSHTLRSNLENIFFAPSAITRR